MDRTATLALVAADRTPSPGWWSSPSSATSPTTPATPPNIADHERPVAKAVLLHLWMGRHTASATSSIDLHLIGLSPPRPSWRGRIVPKPTNSSSWMGRDASSRGTCSWGWRRFSRVSIPSMLMPGLHALGLGRDHVAPHIRRIGRTQPSGHPEGGSGLVHCAGGGRIRRRPRARVDAPLADGDNR